MTHRSSLCALLALMLLAGLLAPNTRTPAAASRPPLCQWAAQLPFWLTGASPPLGDPASNSSPTPTRPPHSPVQYAPLPAHAYQVLVDQPTGTVFAVSDNAMGNAPSPYSASGLLSVLDGATGRPVPWFPTTPPSRATLYLIGSVIPLLDGKGQVYFTCGAGLYQLAADGRPEPAVVSALPVSPGNFITSAVVDEAAHRLFTFGVGGLESFDTRTGKQLFNKPLAAVVGKGNAPTGLMLAVDAQTQRLYVPVSPYLEPAAVSTLDILSLNGTLLHTLPLLGPSLYPSQLALAGTTRRLVVFGCSATAGPSAGPGGESEAVQVINLDTERSLTQQPLRLFFCGTGYPGSRLGPGTAGIVAVDAGAGTAVVLGDPSTPPTPAPQPQPGLAWFINLRTGTRLAIGLPYSCVRAGQQPAEVAIDSRLHRAYVASSGDGLVTILDTRTGRVLGVVQVGGMPTSIAVDEHDQRVVVALDGPLGGNGSGMPGGVAFFPAAIHPAQVPPTQGCGDEVAPYFQGG